MQTGFVTIWGYKMATIKHDPPEVRMTGRSTQQMLKAPHGSFYLVNHEQKSYARNLAHKHHRDDLQIMDVESFFNCHRYMGRTEPIIVDHCLQLNERETETLLVHNTRYMK